MAKLTLITLVLLVVAVLHEINASFFDNSVIGGSFDPDKMSRFGADDLDDPYQKVAMTKGSSNPFDQNSNSVPSVYQSQGQTSGSRYRQKIHRRGHSKGRRRFRKF